MLTGMFLILFGLKIADVIDWSWWLVASPLLVQGTFVIVAAFFQAALDRGNK